MAKKIGYGLNSSNKNSSLPCRQCQMVVKNVDSEAASVLCWKCVCRISNPNTIILSDLNQEELAQLLKIK